MQEVHQTQTEQPSLLSTLKDQWKEFFRSSGVHILTFLRWTVISILLGLLVGGIGILFYRALSVATNTRMAHPWMVFLLPFAGLLIVFLYRISNEHNNSGTNLVLRAIQSEDRISFKVAPLIFVSTVLTHLCGGSAGREGAALQIGGSIGNCMARIGRFDENDKKIAIMCSMSACFSAVFGTPMAAAIFSMEVISVGIMHYSALVPCIMSSLTAILLARLCHIPAEAYYIVHIPSFTAVGAAKTVLLALLLAFTSALFCLLLHQTEKLYQAFFKNPYLRIFVGGLLVAALSLVFRTADYLNAGLPMIERCFGEGVPWYAWLLKMLFTAVTLGAGYKGGEIVPSFFVGATLGYTIGSLLGFPVGLCAACGMIGVFCGVTNCPITSILIGFELFGLEGMPYFLLTVGVCYMLSGYYGLYHSQKIVYSKYQTKFINQNTH